jgi:hypothetical protein
MNAERFAKGMTFDDYVTFTGSPENLAREGFDIRKFSLVRPRIDWSGYMRDRYTKARLTDEQASAITWLAARAGGPAKIAVISEDWSSDCRRDVPWIARLAEVGGLDLRIFLRDGDKMLMKGLPDPASGGNADLVNAYANEKGGERFATVPVAVFYAKDFTELYRYIEFPAIFHKSRVIGAFRAAKPGESEAETKSRAGRDINAMFESPFYDLWARAAIDEIISALHEKAVIS